MSRLIDADELCIKVIDASYFDNADEDIMLDLVDAAPAIDAVPVVRCKDCEYAYINSFSMASGVVLCRHWTNHADGIRTIMQQDGYCSYGERRDNIESR